MGVDRNAVTVVVTAYGNYVPNAMEIFSFQHVYGSERVKCEGYGGTFTEPKWQVELLHYATEQMKSEFESVRVRPD